MATKISFFDEFNKSEKEVTIEESYFNNSSKFVLLVINGCIDTYNSNDFLNIIIKFCKLHERSIIVLDGSGIHYMSSTGIGSFIELQKYCIEDKIMIYLLGIQQNIIEIFTLLGFKSYFNYINDLKDIKREKIIRSIFPYKFECLYCNARLVASKNGSIICTQCYSEMRVNTDGEKVNIVRGNK